MASSVGGVPVQLRFERQFCADPNPAGPGLRQVRMPTELDGEHQVAFQPVWLGSYAVATKPITPGRQIGIGVTLWPTALAAGPQALVTLTGNGWQLVLGIDAAGAFVESGGVRTSVAAPMLQRRWYDVALTLDQAGSLQLTQRPRTPLALARDSATTTGSLPAPRGACTVMLAARPGTDRPATACYNGKLERPTIWNGRSLAQILDAQRVPVLEGLTACWDFSIGIDSNIATDIGPSRRPLPAWSPFPPGP